jgi:TetR/AcrR family transcriptional regulator of autoinduction and epiphytic fitness
MPDSAHVTPLDGRVARSHRTRAAIVEALVSLLEAGNVQPTIEEIAARASVAPRTVFQHYADREALFAAVTAHREVHLATLMGEVPADGPLEERLTAVVEQRARVFEWITPVRRAALLMEPFSENIHAALGFAEEVAALPEAERAARAGALGAAGSFSYWDALRTQQGLDADAATAALRCTLCGLLSV